MNVDKEREKMYKQLEEGSNMNVDKEREKTLKCNWEKKEIDKNWNTEQYPKYFGLVIGVYLHFQKFISYILIPSFNEGMNVITTDWWKLSHG